MRTAVHACAMLTTSAVACVAIGGASAALSPRDGWYEQLIKPAWMPPGWLFGVVWPLLYPIMGAAFALVLIPNGKPGGRRRAIAAFLIQLTLNVAWSPTFFRFHATGVAMAIIVALWLAIGWTAAAFWSVRDLAGVLLLPYWLWVTFAVALNGAIWQMN